MRNITRWYVLLGILLVVPVMGVVMAQPDPTPPSPYAPQPTAVPDENVKPPLTAGGPAAPVPLVSRPDSLRPDAVAAPPVITVWYESDYQFGQRGNPQKWVNILGNVANGNSSNLAVSYTLNGGSSQPINVGPDSRRLALPGDFNVELDINDLQDGMNTVEITAVKDGTETDTKTVNFNYSAGNEWPLPYDIDWSTAATIHDVAQPVDGEWAIVTDTLQPQVLDYDRLVALGDMSWRSYVITVPITINAIDTGGFNAVSAGPGVGIITRWNGHYEDDPGEQPRTGWRDLGALGWYRWSDENTAGLQLIGYSLDNDDFNYPPGGNILGETPKTLQTGVTYLFKMQALTQQDGSTDYSLKVWEQGQTEPGSWDISGNVPDPAAPLSGSAVLVAHHVDADFGNVSVTPLPEPFVTLTIDPPTGGSIQVSPDKAQYDLGEEVTLTAQPAGGTTFTGWTGDAEGRQNPLTLAMNGDKTVSALFAQLSANDPDSDDFNSCTLNSSLWTFVDAKGDSTLLLNGRQARISLPAGSRHDLWQDRNEAPRIVQQLADPNGDFQVVVKFESNLTQRFQLQGIIVEQDAQNWLRFDFYRDADNVNIFGAKLQNGTAATLLGPTPLPSFSTPVYMRVTRTGDVWQQEYSFNGTTWTQHGDNVTHAMSANKVGVFAGNVGTGPDGLGSIPAFTAVFDYFFNTQSPISPEDADTNTITVTKTGQGTITRSPNKASYNCGETVTFTAVPASGWLFKNWSGAISGSANPKTLTVTGDHTVNGRFVEPTDFIYMPFISK